MLKVGVADMAHAYGWQGLAQLHDRNGDFQHAEDLFERRIDKRVAQFGDQSLLGCLVLFSHIENPVQLSRRIAPEAGTENHQRLFILLLDPIQVVLVSLDAGRL